jgi:hypothetical protein
VTAPAQVAAGDSGDGGGADSTQTPATPPSTADWPAATQRVRDTASWIVKAFVALATLLIGTGPLLAHLDKLHADSRGFVALLAAAIALIAVGAVIWLAADVNLTQTTDIADLLDRRDPAVDKLLTRVESGDAADLYLGGTTLPGLLLRRRNEVTALKSQTQALGRLSDAEQIKEVQGLVQVSKDNIAQIDSLLANLTGWAGYECVRARFDRARPKMFAAAAVVAVGVIVWVGILGIDSDSKSSDSNASASSAETTSGTIGQLTWIKAGPDADAVKALRKQLTSGGTGMDAAQCDSIGVVSEAGSGSEVDPWQLSVLPRDPCPVHLRFTVDRRLATFAPFSPGDEVEASVTVHQEHAINGFDVVLFLLVGLIMGVVLALGFTRRSSRRGASSGG